MQQPIVVEPIQPVIAYNVHPYISNSYEIEHSNRIPIYPNSETVRPRTPPRITETNNGYDCCTYCRLFCYGCFYYH